MNVCNGRRQNDQSDPQGHELWCDIGYQPEPTGWHIEESASPALSCYTPNCDSPFHAAAFTPPGDTDATG